MPAVTRGGWSRLGYQIPLADIANLLSATGACEVDISC